ncbi:MAG: sodium:solute symporter [bacterium]|nr:sodium:solute symporter [bacterium]
MDHRLPLADLLVIAAYTAGVVCFGCSFARRNRATDAFVRAGGRLPAWAVGLSIFGTYVSSISFLALPGKAFSGDWNAFVFSLSLPAAAWLAVRFFVPFYRGGGHISAYRHLEDRFGPWARTYAVACYLLTQTARMGSVMYLLALPLHQLLGWDMRAVILATGALVTFYTLMGGIEGVIYTDAVQSVVLVAGAVTCAALIPLRMPEGPGQVFRIAAAHGKFGLGGFGPGLVESTFWVVLLYGLFMNLQNFGVDQSYIQRYLSARSGRAAARSVWLSALLYIPVSALFFFIGTALFAWCAARPDFLPPAVQAEAAAGRGDIVFPYFIVHGLPAGATGLLIAAIFAAAMSTVSTSLNCAATLTRFDIWERYVRPAGGERESMRVLRGATLLWGAAGTAFALGMMRVASALDAWWRLSGIFGGGVLGLFLLGYLGRRVRSGAALGGTVAGILVISWMTLSPLSARLPAPLRFPLNAFLIPVVGTLTIMLGGFLLAAWSSVGRGRR